MAECGLLSDRVNPSLSPETSSHPSSPSTQVASPPVSPSQRFSELNVEWGLLSSPFSGFQSQSQWSPWSGDTILHTIGATSSNRNEPGTLTDYRNLGMMPFRDNNHSLPIRIIESHEMFCTANPPHIPPVLRIPAARANNLVERAHKAENFGPQLLHIALAVRHIVYIMAEEMYTYDQDSPSCSDDMLQQVLRVREIITQFETIMGGTKTGELDSDAIQYTLCTFFETLTKEPLAGSDTIAESRGLFDALRDSENFAKYDMDDESSTSEGQSSSSEDIEMSEDCKTQVTSPPKIVSRSERLTPRLLQLSSLRPRSELPESGLDLSAATTLDVERNARPSRKAEASPQLSANTRQQKDLGYSRDISNRIPSLSSHAFSSIDTSSAGRLCMFCGIKPRWFDATTGQVFDHCGNTCRNAAKGMPAAVSPSSARHPSLGGLYPSVYNAPQLGPYPYPPTEQGPEPMGQNLPPYPITYGVNSSCGSEYLRDAYPIGYHMANPYPLPTTASPIQPNGPICVVPGCQKPAWLAPNGVHSLFCGKRCRDNNPHLQQPALAANAYGSLNHLGAAVEKAGLGTRACVICKIRPYDQVRNSLFCSPACVHTAETMAPGIIEIPSGHPKFRDVANQFDTKWTHTNMAPQTAKFIYLILINAAQNFSYNAYRDRVEQEGGFATKGRMPGNESLRFHGTTRACLLGDPGNTQLCSDSTCGLCGIIRTSFDLKLYKGKTGWGQFGCGFYTSATSSKSDSYTSNKKASQYKAMLISKVIVGNGYKLTNNATQLTGPPAGYHSVLGEPDTAGALNYDKLVVYDNDAIRPAYLVVY
ncbi:SubName: Full=Uncharacterized protein {ECO:0000313/EMBL:CCA71846.1} [Serendipita indica DSM 11827]|uniref:PARP catalytic domain-containing protein n=1 Tax=Serendipita indica (strain DSM 11827) TaxID=1109443 RepID=G4TKK3_SERID|nr:SubName: Full=Uncharacterized protein {ECO:0000313/EMBL:CCA71846.1} [Serendipita indica DSM 11827]CCA71846.1 hypothetical protein PIIN_05781 [Serendipita indica DSM 11827]